MRDDILQYFDTEVRKRLGILASEYRREFDGKVRRTIGPVPSVSHNWIDHFDLTADEVVGAIDQQIAAYQEVGHAFRWKVYSHDRPEELAPALLGRGFQLWEECTLMILDVNTFEPNRPEGIGFRQLTDPETMPQEWRPVQSQVWDEGSDDFNAAIQAEMRDMGESMAIFIAQRNNSNIGTGLVRYTERRTFGGLFAGATIPSARGQGVYRGMVSIRVEHARKIGAAYLYTEAGSMSRPILEKIGFRPLSMITNYAFHDSAIRP